MLVSQLCHGRESSRANYEEQQCRSCNPCILGYNVSIMLLIWLLGLCKHVQNALIWPLVSPGREKLASISSRGCGHLLENVLLLRFSKN